MKRFKGVFRSRKSTSSGTATPTGPADSSTSSVGNETTAEDLSPVSMTREPKDRLGLHSLWPSELDKQRDTKLDIVAVHGLGGDAFNTFKDRDTGSIWLRDFLPNDLQNAHIMSFGYNSGTAFTGSVSGIDDFAVNLLESLRARRRRLGTQQSPIVFICHSLGGIVAKKALIKAHERQAQYEDFIPYVKGIVFFGTPHRGSDLGFWGTILGNIANVALPGSIRTDLLKDLESKSKTLGQVCDQFVERGAPLQIITFYERLKLHNVLVVDEMSAKMYLANERTIPIEADHISMCKFSSAESKQYEIVLGHLLDLAQKTNEPTATESFSDQTSIAQQPLGNITTGNFSNVNTAQVGNNNTVTHHYHSQERDDTLFKGNEHWVVKRKANAQFTGQQHILNLLKQKLLPTQDSAELGCRQFVLQGMGGVGKSELAIQFATRHQGRYWGIFWIDCSSTQSAVAGFEQISQDCGWTIEDGLDAIEATNNRLARQNHPWLLILDNCDDSDTDNQKYLPSGRNGCVILTTRLSSAIQYGSSGFYEITGLSTSDAMDLLWKTSDIRRRNDGAVASAKTIVDRLGAHTLAITVAGSLLRQGLYSLEEYSNRLESQISDLLHENPKQARSEYGSVFATFDVSAQRLQVQSSTEPVAQHALELLSMLAFLDRSDVSENLFTRAWSYAKQTRGTRDDDDDIQWLSRWHFDKTLQYQWATADDLKAFRRARARLFELALISSDSDTGTISMHPLLHSWAKERLSEADRTEIWSTTAATLANSTEERYDWMEHTSTLQRHLEICYESLPVDWRRTWSPNALCEMLYLFTWQLYRSRSSFTTQVVSNIEEIMPPRDQSNRNVLRVKYLQALCHRQRNQYEDAECILVELGQALQASVDGEFNLRVRTELAVVYLETKKTLKAIPLLEEVAAARKVNMDPEHPERLGTEHNLAAAYLDTGQSVKALPLFEEVVRIQEKILKPEAPSRLASQYQLAQGYIGTGQSVKSLPLMEEVVRMREKTLEPEHPDRLASQHELSRAYAAVNQLPNAINLLEKVVNIQSRTLPAGNRDRFVSERNLITYYLSFGNLHPAAKVYESVRRYENLLSAENKEWLQGAWWRLQHEIALDLEKKEQLAQAIEALETVVESSRSLSADDQNRMISDIVLARLYLKVGRGNEAGLLVARIRKDCPEEQQHPGFRKIEEALARWQATGRIAEYDDFVVENEDRGVTEQVRSEAESQSTDGS